MERLLGLTVLMHYSSKGRGELCGFFAGSRGLRQGDPMSPYLFTLAMEVFSGIMHEASSDKRFKYHWRCPKEKRTRLCFADDLLIFCKGEEAVVSIVKNCLLQFKEMSGLTPNPGKSNM